ncbi:hypothetical protein FV226_07970 [Methylobacterium sp. WL12]|nr:hypothetical protein FV226_07970 [Methylobacterium sp. WL12]
MRGEARPHPVVQPGSERRSRSEGEGERTEEAHPGQPPHRRLPPRSADDEVGRALSPQAGRGDAHSASRRERRWAAAQPAGQPRQRALIAAENSFSESCTWLRRVPRSPPERQRP